MERKEQGHIEQKEPVHHAETHHAEGYHMAPGAEKNSKLWIMAIALGLLILIAGVQAVEMVSLKNKLANDITALGAASKSSVSSGGGLAKNLESLPSMVGGC